MGRKAWLQLTHSRNNQLDAGDIDVDSFHHNNNRPQSRKKQDEQKGADGCPSAP
jgi:hypothetical protein